MINIKSDRQDKPKVGPAGSLKSILFADFYSGNEVGNIADGQSLVTLQESLDKALQFIIDEDYKQALSWLLGAYAVMADRATYFSFIEDF